MTTEEAKKILLNSYPMATKHDLDDENKANKEAIEVVLKELDKKDDVIDEMAKYMAFPYKISINKGRMPICIAIKDYFYKKVEEQE